MKMRSLRLMNANIAALVSRSRVACILATLLLVAAFAVSAEPKPANASPIRPLPSAGPASQQVVDLEPRYLNVRDQYLQAGMRPTEGVRISIPAPDFTSRSSVGDLDVVDNFEGRSGPTLIWQDDVEWVEWTFDIEKPGLYNIVVEYYPIAGNRSSIHRELKIDGAYPFLEAKRTIFYRVWRDAGPPERDRDGNDLRPPQREAPRWMAERLKDGEGWYSEPFEFAFHVGTHTLRLVTVREPIAIGAIHIVSPRDVPTYADARERYRQAGLSPVAETVEIKIQAELPSSKADPTVRGEVEYGPLTEPQAEGLYRLNQFGGWRWRLGGRWVEWTFDVPSDGLYQLFFRMWQGYESGLPVPRSIEIDGQVPFQEFREVFFPRDRQWRGFRPETPDDEPYLVHLTRGQHVIRLTPVVGPLRHTLWAMDEVTLDMSLMAREVTMVAGAQPDPNRIMWKLADRIPDLVGRLDRMADLLEVESDRLVEISGYRPNAANSLLAVADQLRSLADQPDTLPGRIEEFRGSQSIISTWQLTLRDQPLNLDYLLFASPDAELPRATPNIFEYIWSTIANFFASFQRDYIGIGSRYEVGESEAPLITVWVARGREWGMIMKDMIEDDFTPNTGIRVNVEVFPPNQVAAGGLNVILLAAATGKAPDVATGVDPNLPVEFAIRNAIVDLSQFPDYPEVEQRFRPGAITPYRYQDGVFGIPESQDFNMLFYRVDILAELGLEPPNTWEETYDVIWQLHQHGLDFYYPQVGEATIATGALGQTPGFNPFLFQRGGQFYSDDKRRSGLDTPEALAAIKEWTGLYRNYKIPLQANFFNRMRTGEIPIGVSHYWDYILFSTAAPELIGRWKMVPLPGTPLPDGTIDRSSGGEGRAVVMLKSSKLQDESWEFMKWWMSAEVQTRYAQELQALIGVEARWNTANVEALENLPWPREDIAAIQEQWKWFKERPVVLGGYFTDRHIVNAWNRIVLLGWSEREAVEEAVRDINRELEKKREEFGLEANR